MTATTPSTGLPARNRNGWWLRLRRQQQGGRGAAGSLAFVVGDSPANSLAPRVPFALTRLVLPLLLLAWARGEAVSPSSIARWVAEKRLVHRGLDGAPLRGIGANCLSQGPAGIVVGLHASPTDVRGIPRYWWQPNSRPRQDCRTTPSSGSRRNRRYRPSAGSRRGR